MKNSEVDTLLDTLHKINDKLDCMKSQELDSGSLTICHNGKSCDYRKVFRIHTLCTSAVPCFDATDHKFVIYKSR